MVRREASRTMKKIRPLKGPRRMPAAKNLPRFYAELAQQFETELVVAVTEKDLHQAIAALSDVVGQVGDYHAR